MKPHDKQIIHSSKLCNWGTPQDLFDALNREANFAVDAAADSSNAKCPLYFGPDHLVESARDCLSINWFEYLTELSAFSEGVCRVGPVFINPPYSRELGIRIEPFIEKAALEASKGLTVYAVIPASIQTKWWQEFVWSGEHRAQEIRFIPHRVSFEAPESYEGQTGNNASGNTAVVIWRPNPGYVGPWQPSVRYWTWREE